MKYESELQYWMKCFVKEGKRFDNNHYADRCLRMAQEPDDTFLRDKIVADFGCGPRGSLAWTHAPEIRIGIDVLASTYINCFGQCMLDHNMIYVTSTETVIPIPSASIDVMFTMNAMDHVDDLSNMSAEVLRVLKPGGMFLGSFNLHEPATSCEPQTLTEELIRKYIVQYLHVSSYRLAVVHPKNAYKFMIEGKLATTCSPSEKYVLWVKGIKKA
ncbi:MAG: class I SAM-dependent methyltransferase [Thermodesulfobacteriota bacterium]